MAQPLVITQRREAAWKALELTNETYHFIVHSPNDQLRRNWATSLLLAQSWSKNTSMSDKPAPMLRLRVTQPAEHFIRTRHPWVYSDSITDMNREGDIGELAVVYDRKNEFLALGLYDPHSPIRLRVLHAGKPVRADDAWWRQRIRDAKDKRTPHFDEAQTNGWRWISGESDGFPGLVLDRYADTLVLKIYSAVWLPRLQQILGWLQDEFKPGAIILRLSRNIQYIAKDRWQAEEGCVYGTTEDLVLFRENGITFEAEVMHGQKTGFYLDQRDNRARVEQLAKDRDVLNVFSFSGGFSLYAARGGARSVTDLDISKHALDSACQNMSLNPWTANVPHECIQADAFEWLANGPPQGFDLIVCDPPSLARREVDREGAMRAYYSLAQSCLRRLRRDGILVCASCSAHVTEHEFMEVIAQAADEQVQWTELWRADHAVDHPATFPEARYLKCIAIQIGAPAE